jgi:hypothetical protein
MDEELSEFYMAKYSSQLNPGFIKATEDKDHNVIGFIVSLRSLSLAMRKTKGHFFPFGYYHIKQALKKPKVVDLLPTGIHPDWQARGSALCLLQDCKKL